MLRSFSRRGFLCGTAALTSTFGRFGSAHAASSRPRRLVIFYSPNGTKHSRYWPDVSDTLTFASGSILEPLASHARNLTVVKGVHFKTQVNHEPGQETMLTGVTPDRATWGEGKGQSVDQYVASAIGETTPLRDLALGVVTDLWGANIQTRMLYGPGHTLVHPDQSPANVYKRLFGSAGGASATPNAAAIAIKRRKSVLDVARAELEDLRRALGQGPAAERAKLDAHSEALFSLEKRLTGAGTPPPTKTCVAPTPVAALDPNAQDNFPTLARAQIDLLALALACGRTNVATLQMAHTVGPLTMSWLGHKDTHHELSHQQSEAFVQGERFYAQQFGYLLDALAALPESDGQSSVLDNTLCVWSKEIADGTGHDGVNVPWVLAGATGALRGGRCVDVGAQPHNKLLVWICKTMGLPNTSYGTTQFGTGALEGLS